MKRLVVLSILGVLMMSLWEESGCRALTLNSTPLPQVRKWEAAGRTRRSWVWNQFFVLEEYTGEEPLYVGKLHSDADKGDGHVRYMLRGDGAVSTFTIDENTGDIHATKRLDREQQAYYTLQAQARDRTSNLLVEPESHFVIKVQDINDNEPKFLDGPYTARVAEMSPVGTSVVTVVATDADDPTYGNSAKLIYSILQGAPFFSVEPKSGLVRTSLPDMDREARDRYLLVIQATDMMGGTGGLTGTTSINVLLTDVNDNPPRFPRKSYQFCVAESSLVASVVARIWALDPDLGSNAEVDYRILGGDDLGTFSISSDPNTQEGLLTLEKALDFETRSSFVLHVEASNRHVDTRFLSASSFCDVAELHLLVENVDEPPIFSPAVSHMSVSEAAPVETAIGSVSAHDPDTTNSHISYSIDWRSDLGRYFEVDRVSGLLRTSRLLDRELRALHNITVVATKSLDPSQVGTAVVLVSVMDVNDNAPRFANSEEMFVCEDAMTGQDIRTLSAVDRDEPPNGHHFLFSVAIEATDLNFILRDNQDNTASILTQRAGFLRREQPVHFLPVVVLDDGSPPLGSTATLSITVCHCDASGARTSCTWRSMPLLEVNFQTAIVAVALTCAISLLGVAVALTCHGRNRGEALMMDDEREIRENIVRYDDEGGGEVDTEAFHMFALRKKRTLNLESTLDQDQDPMLDCSVDHGLDLSMKKHLDQGLGCGLHYCLDLGLDHVLDHGLELSLDAGLYCGMDRNLDHRLDVGLGHRPPALVSNRLAHKMEVDGTQMFQVFMRDWLQEADLDPTAPPYDSLQIYAFEGVASPAESLSLPDSLHSLDSEQSYDFLWEWGLSFRKLADLYGPRGREGGGAS